MLFLQHAKNVIDNKTPILSGCLGICVPWLVLRSSPDRISFFYRLMPSFLRIKHWDNLYENSRSRAIENARWVPIPNKHDGLGFSRIMARKDGLEIFACWILILQVASKCKKRGDLLEDDGGPLTVDDIILKARINPIKKKIFGVAIEVLMSKQILWIEAVTFGNDSQMTLDYQASAEEGKRIEENRSEGKSGRKLPTLADWLDYAKEKDYPKEDAESAFDHYIANGWKQKGGNLIKDWKAAVRTCKRLYLQRTGQDKPSHQEKHDNRDENEPW